ncbi:hypothetical protein PENSPDRAFT_655511 [Peniophora sp. CONT]|nr:hypothetical protein PENSPDRAFT_655511 [Peniophora sp. CONT]
MTPSPEPPDAASSHPSTTSTSVEHNANGTAPRHATVLEKPTETHVLNGPEDNYHFYANAPPPLNYSIRGNHSRERGIAIWFGLWFTEAGILPLVLFYAIRWGTHLSITINLAIITSLIGAVSGYKMSQRTYYLWIKKGHEHRRPIGAGRWGVDCCSVLFGIAATAFFVPLIIGSSLSPAEPRVVAMSLPCIMIAMGLPLLVTGLLPHKISIPFRCSSLPAGRPLPPIAYMFVEDIVAVDGGGGQEFRQAWRTRYEESRIMRKIIRDASIGWGLSGVLLGGALIAIDWTVDQDTGYGLGYGIPWLWGICGTIGTSIVVHYALKKEAEEWVAPKVHKERILPIEEGRYDRPSLDELRRRSSQRDRARPGPGLPPLVEGEALGANTPPGGATPVQRTASVPTPSKEKEEKPSRLKTPAPAHMPSLRSAPG